jgi:succinoglycan biosynthesis transport protein ExoP
MNSLVKIEPAFPVSTSEAATLFADVVTAFFRNKLKIASTALVFLLLVMAIFVFRPKKYESRMLFLVRDEASAFPTDSFDDHAESSPDSLATDRQIGTEIELLSGTDLHRQVITAMNPGLSGAEIDRRLLALDKDLNVLPVPKTRLISVSYLASSKEEGQATLAALSRAYLAYRASIKGSDGAYAFFDQQAKRYSEKVQEDQAALATFNQTYQISLLNEEKDLTVHRLSDARANLYENEASLGEAGKRIQTMSAAREKLSPRVVTQRRDLPDQIGLGRLNSILADLQNERVDLLMKYHPTDRHVQEVDDKIANIRESLKHTQESKATEEQSDLNPLRQSVDSDLQQLTFHSAGLQARQRSLTAQVNEYEAKLQQLNQVTGQYDDLTRKIQEDQTGYDLYSKKREGARINRTLDSDKIANVRQVSGPSIVPQSNGQVLLSVAGVCIMGTLLIVGTGILGGLWSSRFHSPQELESAIGAPVLATVPLIVDGNPRKTLAGRSDGPMSLSLNGSDLYQDDDLLEPINDSGPQVLSPISRYIGSVDRECFQDRGAYLPLIERLRKIDPSEPGIGAVFTFTACTRGEGVSHFVQHLGTELASYTGKRVAIVDAPDTYGSTMGNANGAGTEARGRSARGGESFLKQWFQKLRLTHDYVLIDCPALSVSRAATIFGPQSDGLLLVVGAGEATRNQLRGSLSMLSLSSVPVIGLALNKRRYPVPDAIYNLL